MQVVRSFAKGPLEALGMAGTEFSRLGTQIVTGAHLELQHDLRCVSRPAECSKTHLVTMHTALRYTGALQMQCWSVLPPNECNAQRCRTMIRAFGTAACSLTADLVSTEGRCGTHPMSCRMAAVARCRAAADLLQLRVGAGQNQRPRGDCERGR